MSSAVVFPGQGSQRKGMGADLFARFPAEVAAADTVLGYSVAELCTADPLGRLRDTEYAQPALFVVNALRYLAREDRTPPEFLAGHSLGELNALRVAGCFDFATGVAIVARRGALMAAASGGGMVAVVGLAAYRVAEVLAGFPDVDLANYNSPTQTVIAGPVAALREAADALRAEPGARCVPLAVSAAFHSRQMRDAATAFADYLETVPLAAPRLRVLANATGMPYPAGENPASLLARQVDGPVRWLGSMRFLLAEGVTSVEEMGGPRVLTPLWREAAERHHAPNAEADSDERVPGGRADLGEWAAGDLGERVPGAGVDPGERAAGGPADLGEPVPGGWADLDERTAGAGADPGELLGSAAFRRDFGIRYAYLAGSMFRGIASIALVRRLGEGGLLGFFGAAGLPLTEVEDAIKELTGSLGPGGRWGMNLLCPLDDPELEQATVELYLRHDVRFVEAAGYPRLTGPLLRLRYSGAHLDSSGRPVVPRQIVAKVSRPEVARAFCAPAPAAMVADLLRRGWLTPAEADVAGRVPVSENLCVESDSGGHTDGGVALALLPAMVRLRDEVAAAHPGVCRVRVGAAGGLGAPEAIAAAFVLGAEFVVTGSVNQCTPQAGISDLAKDLLAALDVQDTGYAPAGDMFEFGARAQVVRKGTLFASRANKLYQIYRTYDGLDALPERLRRTLEHTYFRRSIDEVWQQTRDYHLRTGGAAELDRAQRDSRHRMALVFRWYFAHSVRMALAGTPEERVNFQIQCGPAMGAFNRLVAGTELADWRARDPVAVAELLMRGAADRLASPT